MFTWLVLMHGSCYRATRAMKSSCEGQLHFLVGQKRRSSSLVILNIFARCHLWKCWNVDRIQWIFWKWFSCNSKLIHFGLKKLLFHSITNKNSTIAIMQGTMGNIFNRTNFWLIFSPFLWHKILVLIFAMFIFLYMWRLTIQNPLSFEMYEGVSDFYLYI